MPLSLLEAMSYQNCCLTSDIPECTEVTEDHGAAFRRGEIEALAQKLQQLCDEPETVREYKGTACDFICGKYNWDAVTEKTLDLYGWKR
jgi:glycosyltransferase involved in cell wall biosynthesis